MSSADRPANSARAGQARFATTRWSLVLSAGKRSSPQSAQALESLCRSYWYPLYAYVRRRVCNPHDAQDLTQEFFATLLQKDYLRSAKRERGRFRSFLITAFKHFLANEWDKAKAQKRGGGRASIPLDFDSGEARYALEPIDELSAERIYDIRWVSTLLDNVLSRLREEFVAKGTETQFELLKEFISGDLEAGSYERVSSRLKMSIGAVRVATHRLRRRYREVLRAEIAETIADQRDVDDEIRSLFMILG